MITWMEHAYHGRMPVYNQIDVQANEKHGWKVVGHGDSPPIARKEEAKHEPISTAGPDSGATDAGAGHESPAGEATAEETGDDAERIAAVVAYENLFGRRPHHRMSTANIVKAVKDGNSSQSD